MKTAESAIRHLTPGDFDAVIADTDKLTIVDFWAPWCGPCKMMEPILEAFAGEHRDNTTVAKVNVDDAAALASRYEIRSIPTIVFFKDGQEIDRITGAVGKAVLDEKLGVLADA